MECSDELIKKARAAESAEEIKQIAKSNNIPLADGEAERIFRAFNAKGEVSDSELENVAAGRGGCYESGETPKYKVGQQCGYFKSGLLVDSVEYGLILSISDEKHGTFYKEFVYTIRNDDDGTNDEVDESYIFKAK